MAGWRFGLMIAMLAGSACDGGGNEPAETPAASPSTQCPRVSMDGMDGRWIKYTERAIREFRFEIAQGADGPELWYTGGGFSKRRLVGERRADDYVFSEAPTPDRERRYKAGDLSLVRLYVEPQPNDCSLRVMEMELEWRDGQAVEKPKGSYVSYVEYPEDGPDLAFRYCDQELFIAEAATDRALADEQLAGGGPRPDASLGDALSLGTWTPELSEADGCSYEMKLYFDDQPARTADGGFREPTAVVDGRWLVQDWYAPYSGNHHFQMYQYKTCGGGQPELVGVACLEAVLR